MVCEVPKENDVCEYERSGVYPARRKGRCLPTACRGSLLQHVPLHHHNRFFYNTYPYITITGSGTLLTGSGTLPTGSSTLASYSQVQG